MEADLARLLDGFKMEATNIGEYDVVIKQGRKGGGGSAGNRLYDELIQKNGEAYAEIPTENKRQFATTRIVDPILNRGGRFLKPGVGKEEAKVKILSKEKAEDAAMQKLRDQKKTAAKKRGSNGNAEGAKSGQDGSEEVETLRLLVNELVREVKALNEKAYILEEKGKVCEFYLAQYSEGRDQFEDEHESLGKRLTRIENCTDIIIKKVFPE
mmetsp:Transcript_14458/g.34983  ORF Transcript_14458/g.34983 Transcript_14458/m.34983 type:complete len:212 (-) Transcript_14458:50-685(-)